MLLAVLASRLVPPSRHLHCCKDDTKDQSGRGPEVSRPRMRPTMTSGELYQESRWCCSPISQYCVVMWSHGLNPPPCYVELVRGNASSNRKPRRAARAQGLSTPRNNPGGCHLILHNYTHQPTLLPEYQALPPPPSPRPNMGRGTFPSRRAGETDRSERRPGQNWLLRV